MPYDKSKPYSCPCCGYWNGDMKYDYYRHIKPLIKDEKIRKAVRAWAEMNDIRYIEPCARTDKRNYRIVGFNSVGRSYTMEIDNEFNCRVAFAGFGNRNAYTIDELCGEEAPEPLEPTFIDLDERIKEKDGICEG